MANKIILKENGINNAGDSPSGYKYLGFDGESFSEKSGATVSSIGGSLVRRLIIRGFSGDGIPGLAIVENTLVASGGGSVTVDFTGTNNSSLTATLSDTSITRNNTFITFHVETQLAYNTSQSSSILNGVISISFSDDTYYKIMIEQI